MRLYSLLGALLLMGCADDPRLEVAPSSFPQLDDTDSFPPPAEGEGFQLAFEYIAPASAESWNCLVADIPPASIHPVQTALSRQSESVHHMKNLFEVIAQWEVQKRSTGRGEFHGRGQSTLYQCQLTDCQTNGSRVYAIKPLMGSV